jgi:hypothetical protein
MESLSQLRSGNLEEEVSVGKLSVDLRLIDLKGKGV